MKPKKPCPWCDGRSFAVVKRVRPTMHSSAKKGFGNEIQEMFTMLVCHGCGATQLFCDPGKMLDGLEHETVELTDEP